MNPPMPIFKLLGHAPILCAAFLATAPLAATVHAGDFAKTFSVAERAKVHVQTNDASVTVSTGDAQQVEVRVAYQGYELDKTLHVESRQQGDDIEFTARVSSGLQPSFGNFRRVHIEVRMPKNADLHVETNDGAIQAGGLSGTIDLHTGDGSVTVNSLRGVVRLHTGDGGIDGSDLDGSCEAVSGDGRIRLAGRFDVLSAKSGDGGIHVAAAQGSKLESGWSISSHDGGIDVALPGDLPADLDASTGDGHVSSDLPVTVEGVMSKSRLRGKMNGGGGALTIHSGDGSIHLRKA